MMAAFTNRIGIILNFERVTQKQVRYKTCQLTNVILTGKTSGTLKKYSRTCEL